MSRTYVGLYRILVCWKGGHALTDAAPYEFCQHLLASFAHQPFDGHWVTSARIVGDA